MTGVHRGGSHGAKLAHRSPIGRACNHPRAVGVVQPLRATIMVAVRVRQFGNRETARRIVPGRRLAGDACQLLQQRQRLQLQGVEIERVAFCRHWV